MHIAVLYVIICTTHTHSVRYTNTAPQSVYITISVEVCLARQSFVRCVYEMNALLKP